MASKHRNERLAEALARANMSASAAAEVAGVDPRTVDRWVDDRRRLPRAQSRLGLAAALDTPVGVLWPQAPGGPNVTEELVALYPARSAMPTGHVTALMDACESSIDVLVMAGMWLWDSVPGFGELLAAKSAAGVDVRLCVGDPAGSAVKVRGAEEGVGELLAGRCSLALSYARRWLGPDSRAIRVHDTTLYASILRFDDDVLVNWHLFGAPAGDSPVLHLSSSGRRGLARSALESLERVWASAEDVPTSHQ